VILFYRARQAGGKMKFDGKVNLAAICGVCLLLSACSSGDSTTEGGPAGGETYNGLTVYGLNGSDGSDILAPPLAAVILNRQENSPGSGDARVIPVMYGEETSVKYLVDYYRDSWDNETWNNCVIESSSGSETGTGASTADTRPYVNAGPFVVINSPAGPWFTINQGTDLLYDVSDTLGPLPDGASLTIPGEIFPRVENYPLYQPATPVRLSPVSATASKPYEALVTLDTQYKWVPDGDPGTDMVMSFWYYDGVSYTYADLYCRVEDDGEFLLPDSARAHIASAAGAVTVYYNRVMRRFDYVDGVALYQSSAVAE